MSNPCCDHCDLVVASVKVGEVVQVAYKVVDCGEIVVIDVEALEVFEQEHLVFDFLQIALGQV